LVLRPALSPTCPPRERLIRIIGVAAYLALGIVLFAFFYPIHTAEVIPYQQWYLRMWFPSWV
jgi:dolichyl-phosphate-mannose--protein O-mannosyl transferase